MTRHFGRTSWLVWMGVLALLPTVAMAAKRAKSKVPAKQVELFQAMKDGQIEVKLIPKDSTETGVLIKNKTKQPLSVKLPKAFAGVPVLAQFGPAGGGGGAFPPAGGGGPGAFGGGNRPGGGSQNQGFGGGMGGFGGGGGMGMFNVPPEKVGRLKVPTVCLEHGKKDPAPNVPYEIKPLANFTEKAGVRELCEALGTGRLSQRAAQAAAWHLNNDMSWRQLAAKRIRSVTGMTRPYFTPMELRVGRAIAAKAKTMAEQRSETSSEKSLSLSY